MANDRRKQDRIQKYSDRVSKIAYGVGIAFIIYLIFPMESRLTKRIEKLEEKQDRAVEMVYQSQEYCKNEINEIRKDMSEKILAVKEWVRERIR